MTTLPEPFYQRDGITIYVGDNSEILPRLDTESVSAVVSDPPSGISFMNANWDSHKGGRNQWIAWLASVLSECKRVMLPGAHALIWALPRTSGWTSMAIEDAGLDVRDCITHLFGSGFPKSHNIAVAIDKQAGAIGHRGARFTTAGIVPGQKFEGKAESGRAYTDPKTPEAQQWQGWGTALKPAAEFWYLARKPFKGNVAQNVLAHGTGAINVDASRIGTDIVGWGGKAAGGNTWNETNNGLGKDGAARPVEGRWPANVILDEAAADALDAQSGERKSGGYPPEGGQRSHVTTYGKPNERGEQRFPASTGGASRFFYCAKASRRERNAGLDGMPVRPRAAMQGNLTDGQCLSGKGEQIKTPMGQNVHPTVKPLALMRYLIQMVTPPGGIILDPFMGSGSTLVAAAELGFHAIGIELDPEYAAIAARRVDHALNERARRLPGLENAS